MKEIKIRALIAVCSMVVMYLLMSFVVNSLSIGDWDKGDRVSIALIQGFIILMLATFPEKISKLND
jgi:hypothetical protein